MTNPTGVLILTAFAVCAAVLLLPYLRWRRDRLLHLATFSEVAQTAMGPVEYVLLGDRGPVVLFVHGTPGSCDQAVAIRGDYRTLAPSRPGFLRTPLSVGETPAQQAEAFAALLDALNIDQVVVMAASGGGPSGLCFAANYPDRTLGLIAVETVAISTTLPRVPALMKLDVVAWLALGAIDRLGPDGMSRVLIPDPANRQRIQAEPANGRLLGALVWAGWPGSLHAGGTDNDANQFRSLALPLGKITAPTLIIHGTADINVPLANAEALAAAVQGSRSHIIEGADHFMPYTHKGEFDAVVAEFLSDVFGRQRSESE